MIKRVIFIQLIFLSFTASLAAQTKQSVDANLPVIVEELNSLLKNQPIEIGHFKLLADSLLKEAKQVDNAYFLGHAHYFEGEYLYLIEKRNQSITSYNLALQFFQTADNIAGLARTNFSLAEAYFANDNYSAALLKAESALLQSRELDDKALIAASLSLICDVYTFQGRYEQAINNCLESIKLQEELGIEEGMHITLNAMGNIYRESGSLEKAESYFFNALTLSESLNDQYGIATALSNLGNLYLDNENNPQKALGYFNRALELDSMENDSWGLAYSYHDLAKAYNKMNEYDKAIDFLTKAKLLAEEVRMSEHLANIHIELANSYVGNGRYQAAIVELKLALNIAQRINTATLLRTIYRTLSRNYDRINDKDNALVYMRLYTMQMEKIYKEESARAIAEAEAFYDLEKKEREISLLRKENEIKSLQSTQQRFGNYALGGFLFMFSILIVILYNRNTFRNKVNKELQQKNAAINQQNEEIQSQRDDIITKNMSLSEKNRQITDSIFYAQQIQQSLLPDMKDFHRFFPQAFIFYRPKDIVSGDFYWFADLDDRLVFAVIDCTGHGVPGAFMTVLANSLLNQIVLESKIYSPELVISLLDQKIKQNLHYGENRQGSTDGLDIGLCFLDKKTNLLTYSGAGIPLYYFHSNKKILALDADRFSAGSSLVSEKSFTKKELQLKKGDVFYMATDGFQDQFGGENDRKFMKSRFKNLLFAIHHKPIAEQEDIITRSFQKWRKNNLQTDDVLIVGIKI